MVTNTRGQLCIVGDDRQFGKRPTTEVDEPRFDLEDNIEPERSERPEKGHVQDVLPDAQAKLGPYQKLAFDREFAVPIPKRVILVILDKGADAAAFFVKAMKAGDVAFQQQSVTEPVAYQGVIGIRAECRAVEVDRVFEPSQSDEN